jgi:hypothetical protein
MTLSLAGALVALPLQTNAWVAAAGGYRGGYHGVAVGVYHPPCYHVGYSCGGVSTGTAVAAGMAGLAVGAAIGSAAAHPTYVVAPAPVVVYAPPPVYVAPGAPIGSVYYSLPYGAQSANINGTQYYVLSGSYYKPYFGNNGVYYQVVPNPI